MFLFLLSYSFLSFLLLPVHVVLLDHYQPFFIMVAPLPDIWRETCLFLVSQLAILRLQFLELSLLSLVSISFHFFFSVPGHPVLLHQYSGDSLTVLLQSLNKGTALSAAPGPGCSTDSPSPPMSCCSPITSKYP